MAAGEAQDMTQACGFETGLSSWETSHSTLDSIGAGSVCPIYRPYEEFFFYLVVFAHRLKFET